MSEENKKQDQELEQDQEQGLEQEDTQVPVEKTTKKSRRKATSKKKDKDAEKLQELGQKLDEMNERGREKGRAQAKRLVRKIDPVFTPRKLNPDDAKVIFHPVDFLVFNGMKRAGPMRNLLLLDRKDWIGIDRPGSVEILRSRYPERPLQIGALLGEGRRGEEHQIFTFVLQHVSRAGRDRVVRVRGDAKRHHGLLLLPRPGGRGCQGLHRQVRRRRYKIGRR